jgi:hypothetical protein
MLRWWNGMEWTEHLVEETTPPAPTPPAPNMPPRYYISNLFRLRYLQFVFLSAILFAGVATWLHASTAVATVIFVATLIGTGWFWLTQQMACRRCGSMLRVTRLTGGQEVCTKCKAPTDASLRASLLK